MPFTCGGDHLENIGKMIEEMEIDLRRNIDGMSPKIFIQLLLNLL